MSSSYVPPATAAAQIMSQQTTAFAKNRYSEVRQSVSEGSCSLRVLALLGALSLLVVSLMGLLSHILYFQWLAAVFDVYIFALGVIMLLLEYGEQLSCFGALYDESALYDNAKFLKYVWGRGILYFVAGTLAISQKSLLHICVGSYVCLTGVVFILAGRSAARKLRDHARATTPEQLQEQFAIADVEGKGSLTRNQFQALVAALHVPLTKHEVESAFLQLDIDQDGRAYYDTVAQWWQNETSHSNSAPVTVM